MAQNCYKIKSTYYMYKKNRWRNLGMMILKVIFLFLAVWFTIANAAIVVIKRTLPIGNILIQTIGIVGFIVLQFNLIN